MKVSYIPYKADEMNDVAFSKKFDYRWSNYLKHLLEDNGHEIHTYDILPFEEADAILSFDNVYYQNFKLFKRIQDCNKLGCVTHIDYEPPSANCKIHDEKGLKTLSKIFKNIITYNDKVIGDNIFKGCIGDFFSAETKYKNDFSDRKLVAILANYRVNLMLFGQHPNELYSKRGEAVKFFQEKCPNEFDLYGNYWPDELKKCYISSVEREDKQDIIGKYRFLISYDSICKQNGYISEKIFDCFNAKTIPIYWGAENVEEYIPKNCFIDKRDFNTYEELYDFLTNFTEDDYNSYIKNIEEYLHSDKYKNLFSSQASAKILFNALTMPKVKRNSLNVKRIINQFDKKRRSNVIYNFTNNFYDYHIPRIIEITSYDLLQKGVDVDYNLKFQFYSSNKYDLKIFYKNNNKYYELPIEREKVENVYNGFKYIFYLSIFDILNLGKISFFVKYNSKFYPLNIECLISFDDFSNYFKIYYYKNIFYVKYNIKDKLLFLYKKNKLLRIFYRLIRLPFRIVKLFLEVFYK